jgi:hypothetical protein
MCALCQQFMIPISSIAALHDSLGVQSNVPINRTEQGLRYFSRKTLLQLGLPNLYGTLRIPAVMPTFSHANPSRNGKYFDYSHLPAVATMNGSAMITRTG